MELRQLEAFVAVAHELHFGRAAATLHLGQPTLSEMVRRLERELGTALFTRTTRRVALTAAGQELLIQAHEILDKVTSATAAVKLIGQGEVGTVRIGITPPVAPVLTPHLAALAGAQLAGIELDVRRMWLPALTSAVSDGTVDIAITCGLMPEVRGVVSHVICAEPLFVGLRPDHRLAGQEKVDLADLADEVLGVPDPSLFPAWRLALNQALAGLALDPPTTALDDPDLGAAHWADQSAVDWVLLIESLSGAHRTTALRPVTPPTSVPYTLQWRPEQIQVPAVARLVDLVLAAPPPAGWSVGG